MTNALFLALLGASLFTLQAWGAYALPAENWQIIAAAPRRKEAGGSWQGVNYTFYGFFTATALVLAVALALVLLRSLDIPLLWLATVMALILGLAVPAARLVARLVEKKAHTFTVGGASFCGIVAAPWVIGSVNAVTRHMGGQAVPVMPVLAALAIALALGEGVGRLACLSFGCCYGKRMADLPPWLAGLLRGYGTVFAGETKKAAYEGGCCQVPLVPVQSLSAAVNTLAALAGTGLFLAGRHASAYLVALGLSLGWRCLAEQLRADFRGGGRLSAYQIMAAAGLLYGVLTTVLLGADLQMPPPVIRRGLASLWQPGAILALQGLWAAIFLYTGRSSVTRASIAFEVVRQRV
ncbi:MAG: prolipoprotein diacylglyceryl transferase family protein [Thermodesulfobacteriota bacterium]